MKIHTNLKLSRVDVLSLLRNFDDSSEIPLHEGVDFYSYSQKLSDFAFFVIAEECNKQLGFIAYYLNENGRFVYIPQAIVHKEARHQGLGHKMFSTLLNSLDVVYKIVRLEVLKENDNARGFYYREGFVEIADHNERFLLEKKI